MRYSGDSGIFSEDKFRNSPEGTDEIADVVRDAKQVIFIGLGTSGILENTVQDIFLT